MPFLINTHGLLDNIAWVCVLQKGIFDIEERSKVGLFKRSTRVHLSSALQGYLDKPEVMKWHREYASNYRDALAHRIPLYVPPFALTDEEATKYKELDLQAWKHLTEQNFDLLKKTEKERDALGSVCPTYLHSFSEANSTPRNIHFQTIEDGNRVVEVADIFCRNPIN